MNILAFDTCMQSCSVAVLRDAGADAQTDEALFSIHVPMARGHAEHLIGLIKDVLSQASLSMSEIDRIAVTTGPGTFTGVRIGIATARGFALASNMDLVGENTLQVIAHGYFDNTPRDFASTKGHLLAVAINARRDQIYFQLFDKQGPVTMGHNKQAGPVVIAPEQAVHQLQQGKDLHLIGSGGQSLLSALHDHSHLNARLCEHGNGDPQPNAASLARHAIDLKPCSTALSPLYLRPPDAKIQSGYAVERRNESAGSSDLRKQ